MRPRSTPAPPSRNPGRLVVPWGAGSVVRFSDHREPWDLMPRLTCTLLAPTCLLLLGVGCDTRTKECNRLVRTVEEHLPALTAATQALSTLGENEETAPAFVAVVEQTQADMTELSFDDPEISGFRDRYDALLERAQETARALSKATRDRSEEAYGKAVASARDVTRAEAALAKEINAYCHVQ